MMDIFTLPDYMVWGPCLDAPWWFQTLYVVSFTVSFGAGIFQIWTKIIQDMQNNQRPLEVHACYIDFVQP